MKETPESLYLDLMKKTLAFALWPEPATPLDVFNYQRPPIKKLIVKVSSWVLKFKRLQLAKTRDFTKDEKDEGKFWPLYAFTMVGPKRLDNVQYCVETAIRDGVEGDLIETGVWRGGSCILMRAILKAYAIGNRKVFVADSFAGLPAPELDKFPADEGDTFHTHDFLAVSKEQVQENFRKFGLLDEQVVFLKGWFKDTLPKAPIDKLSVMRLDGDMYSSTTDSLTNLYAKLSVGGFCIIDDYALKGCKQAVDDFRAKHNITAKMNFVDWSGMYWRKE